MRRSWLSDDLGEKCFQAGAIASIKAPVRGMEKQPPAEGREVKRVVVCEVKSEVGRGQIVWGLGGHQKNFGF